MVSLSRSINTNFGGATFFGESSNMDDRQLLTPAAESEGRFRSLKTIPTVTVYFLSSLTLEIIAIVYAILHPDPRNRCREYFILIYMHVAFWFLTLLVDWIVKEKHIQLRMYGYLNFYNSTLLHHKLPIYVVSLWNAVLLFIQALMQHFYPDNFAEKCVSNELFTPINYVCAFITLEFCLLSGINIDYILRVRKFNRTKPPPDVQMEDWHLWARGEDFAHTEMGYRAMGDHVNDFLQKQADLIRHLKDQNVHLGEKLLILNAQLQAKSRT